MSNSLRLGDYCTKIGSGSTPRGGYKSYVANGIPFIRSQNVLMRSFSADGLVRIPMHTHADMAGTEVIPGDVLLNITGASIGRVCVVPEECCPANVNQHVCIIRCDEAIHPQYLMLYLSSPKFQKFIDDTQAGGTRQALTKTDIENFNFPVVDVATQRIVANKLVEELKHISDAVCAARKQFSELETLPRKLLGRLTRESTWPMRPLYSKCQLLSSKSISTTGDAEVQAITTACLTETGFDPVGIKTALMSSRDAAECVVTPGEILIARSNTPELVGRAALFNGELQGAVASDLTIRIWPGSEVHGDFLVYYLSALYLTGYWREKAGGASGSMKKITRGQILALPIPVPQLEEQREVASQIRNQLLLVKESNQAAKTQLAELKLLPQKLLTQVFGH